MYFEMNESQAQKQTMPDREPNVYDKMNAEKKKGSILNQAENWFDKLRI